MPRLVYVDRQGIERSVPVGTDFPRVTVGRNPDCTIQVTKPSVSRRHSEFTFHDGVLEVTDLGSSNGTFINGREIRRQTLRDRDEVKCGDFVLRVFMEDEFGSHAPPPSSPPPFSSGQQGGNHGYQQQPTQLPGAAGGYDYGRQTPGRQSGGYQDPYSASPPSQPPSYGQSGRQPSYGSGQPASYPGEPDPYSRSGSYGPGSAGGGFRR